MHPYPNSSYEAHSRSEERSVVYKGHGYGGSAQYGMSREMRETSFVNEGYRRKPPSIQSIDQYSNERLDHSYHRGNPQAIELPGMGNPSICGPYVRSPSSSSMDGTQEQTRSREMMERAYVNEGYMQRPPSIQSIEQYPTDRMDHSYHYGNPQAIEQPDMANPSINGILVMPPASPTMDGAREGISNTQRKTKRNSIRVILTRVCSAVLVIADCVFDWMQYNDMKTPLDIIPHIPDFNSFIQQQSDIECTSKEDVAEKYKYFTIAGTVLSVIQLANIIFQIYSEVKFMKEKKQVVEGNDSTQKKLKDKIMKYPKKLLDGRTETLYSVLFIEIPQGLLLLRYQDACVSSCGKTLKGKHLSRRIWSAVNGGIALMNNAFRYLSCSLMCEEEVEDDDKPGCCSGAGGKCIGCLRCLFKCLCPCLCCFHRYECLMCGCWICGKKCICDMCKCYTEPWFCKIPFCGICTFHYCPLMDPENPKGAQKCCDVTSECCNCSDGCSNLFDYEPLVFNTSLATVFNAVYVFVYFGNICRMFCLQFDYPIIETIVHFILSNVADLASALF